MANEERLNEVASRLENVTSRLEQLANANLRSTATASVIADKPPSFEIPPTVKLFDDVVDQTLKEFINLSQQIGAEVNNIATLASDAFKEQRVFLWNACSMQKPGDDKFLALLKPTKDKLEAIQNFADSKRTNPLYFHLKSIGDGIPALGWVAVSPTPAPYIKDMIDASQYYTNRVLKEFKSEKVHSDWVKTWLLLLSDLQKYVKQHHTTGVVWNSSPGTKPPSETKIAKTAPPPPPAGGPPPPPPPPPPCDLTKNSSSGANGDERSRSALFADINKGLDITSRLKKVPDEQKTHKNPSLRKQSPGNRGTPPQKPPKPSHLMNGSSSSSSLASSGKSHTPVPKAVLELQGGKKWIVEHFKDNNNIVIEGTEMKQVVYIYKCINSVIQIKGKINSVAIDSCKKTSVVVDDLVSSAEIINCQSAQFQTLGALPTLAIQKTDGCQVYLSRKALNAEIVSSKSSEMNILVPDESGEYLEFPVPEQYKTVVKNMKLETTAVDIA